MSELRMAFYSLHRRLLPQSSHIGWTPYIWLTYALFGFWKYLFVPLEGATLREFVLLLLTMPLFLTAYFNAFWVRGSRVLLNIVVVVALGVVWAPYNTGTLAFFIFGASFAAMLPRPRDAVRAILIIEAIILAEWWLAGLHWSFPVFAGVFSALIGAVNMYYAEVGRKNAELRLSQEEVRQLAAMAERERIARDLHDLLGHTLSVITLKSELASRYLERGDSRATAEVRDVERISREALREVREAVAGFHRTGLIGELANAKLACEAVGIALEPVLGDSVLPSEQEAVLAMVLREAATNVVRHSGATRCRVALTQDPGRFVLTVSDDGRGGVAEPGMGLSGMKRRLESIGGGLRLEHADGLRLTAWVPSVIPDREDPPGREALA